ncbi:hypothetical protein SDC9_188755 [bioreactor metagenome]|uniref:Uncharacterized protein n=1 Tax=bioreactor metagenome TaxID=1076179 RepID=A0A645I126_9ZZZZ
MVGLQAQLIYKSRDFHDNSVRYVFNVSTVKNVDHLHGDMSGRKRAYEMSRRFFAAFHEMLVPGIAQHNILHMRVILRTPCVDHAKIAVFPF